MDNKQNTYDLHPGWAGTLRLAYLARYSYAFAYNKCKALISCVLANDTDQPWHGVAVELSGPMVKACQAAVDLVPAGASVDLGGVLAIEPDTEALLQLDEPALSAFTMRIAMGGDELFRREFPIELAPYGYWLGLHARPDTTASFVMPGHRSLFLVRDEASRLLLARTGSGMLDEYQSQDVNRARAQVAAVYEALRMRSIACVPEPEGFAVQGEAVAGIDDILESGQADSLGLSLAIASCLESIGMHPLLVFAGGRCLAGAWLVKDSYPKPVGDDREFLLKVGAEGINEVVVFDPSRLPDADFEQAVDSAIMALAQPDAFECFVDVRQARVNGVRPLPRVAMAGGKRVIEDEGPRAEQPAAARQYDRYDLTEYAADGRKATKYAIWERKLLDFSLRNNLLNMRPGKKIIPLVSFSIAKLEDCLQAGETFYVEPFPLDETPQPNDRGMFDSSSQPALKDYIVAEMANKRVHSWQRLDALRESLKHVYRASRTSMEENGANNLYLVLGILKWYETERSQQPRFAPVLLLPIEIVRRAGQTGYVIRTRDEEIVLNITLAELLKQQHDVDLSGLAELPKDDSGVDVKKIFAFIRDRIRNKRGWNVLDESLIGLFSFNKFVMWNDIHANAAKLQQSAIISSLVEGRLNLSDADLEDAGDAKAADLGSRPEDFTIPIEVDSSQLEAVIASGAGRSFILHGPPGTGKSQTITNMIANALYQGKRVLFVAEKMAALSVVQARLAKIGLAPFCLELHSNKVTKLHFLKQMEDALAVTRTQSPANFHHVSEEIYAKRRELIAYIEALHAKDARLGLSLYDCVTSFLSIDGPEMDISIDGLPGLDACSIGDIRERIAGLDAVFKVAGAPAASPLRDVVIIDGSAQAEREYDRLLGQAVGALAEVASHAPKYAAQVGVLGLPLTMDALMWARALIADAMGAIAHLPRECWRASVDPRMSKMLAETCRCGKARMECWQRVKDICGPRAALLNPDAYCSEWSAIQSKWALPRYFAKRAFLKRMAAECKPGFSEQDAVAVYGLMSAIRDNTLGMSAPDGRLRQVFGDLAQSGCEDWDAMCLIASRFNVLAGLCRWLGDVAGISPQEAAERLAQAHPGDDWHQFVVSNIRELQGLAAKIGECADALGALSRIATVDMPDGIDDMLQAMRRWHGAKGSFRDWYAWSSRRQELERGGLKPVVDYLLAGQGSAASAADAFAKSVYRQLARKMIDGDEALRFFNGVLFEQTIEKYRSVTARFQELSKRELYCRLASSIPSQAMAAHDTSELGILKRNIKNGGRGTSIRKIIDQIPALLPRLCPCMLMSPLSVAQYIDLDNEKFDIVIFDEASQMPTSEAVGAIARGKALIVVGDPKQMPPTSFFSTSAVGEEEAGIDDMESILDDCISLSMPSKRLAWHYRSKHESLIAFSNSQYYGGKLITFPSVDDQTAKVSLRSVAGVYDKGSSRSNLLEARAVVDEVLRRLAHPELGKLSIGIVSFSKVQQDKIEDLLMDELAKRPDLEAAALEVREPIFVKNLENVQGDERDVILFSIGYGPDKDGRVSMNFGPLNNAGGERRLNVAVSRARHEMIVFSSLRSDQIDLRRTSALGVEGLKRFLEYAETGRAPMAATQVAASEPCAVAEQIARRLAEAGYKASVGVGRSRFRVDVAVANPERPSEYLLGILCDGPSYYATKTVRDREVVQPSVLKSLNWNVMRVWTLDWFERPAQVLDAIEERIASILSNYGEQTGQDEPAQEEEEACAPEPVPLPEDSPCVPYRSAPLGQCGAVDNEEDLRRHARALRRQLETIISVEQPVLPALIYRRVGQAWSIPRMTPRIQAYIDQELSTLPVYREDSPEGAVYWSRRADSMGYGKFRSDSDRETDEVPAIELRNAMLYVAEQQVAINKEDLKKLTAASLGLGRKRSRMDARLAPLLQQLLDEGLLTAAGDTIKKP